VSPTETASGAARRGALLGGALGTAFFLWAILANAGFSVMGVQNDTITQMVFGDNLGLLITTQLRTFGFQAVMGALAGAAVRVALQNRRHADTLTLALLLAAHLSMAAGAVIYAPQLFTEQMFEKGGWRAALQVFLTDHLSPTQARIPAFVIGAAVGGTLVFRAARHRLGRFVLAATAATGAFLYLSRPTPQPRVPAESASVPRRPNVLILGVDSLRDDRLMDPRVMPNLSSLAAGGARFTRAYTAIPRTFPSWISLLTGRYPARNNLRHMFPRAEQRAVDFQALPARLAGAGYRSAVVSDFAGDIFSRVSLGFDEVIAPTFRFPTLIEQRSVEIQSHLLPYIIGPFGRSIFPVVDELAQLADANLVSDRAQAAIERLSAGDHPWLLTVFYGNAHFPYAAQWPHYREFTDPAYPGRFRYHRPPDVEGTAGPPTEQDARQIRGLFDGALNEVDAGAARLLAYLDAVGERENTIVIILADHGEHLGEPGMGIGHGEHLRGENALRIPLVVSGPGIRPGQTRDEVVRSVDVVPTLLGLLELPSAPGDFDGQDLSPTLRQGVAPTPQGAYAETGIWFTDKGPDFFQRLRMPYPDITALCEVDKRHRAEVVLKREWAERINVAKHRAWIEGDWKLIYVPLPDRVVVELYDTREDPPVDRAAEHPDVVARMSEALYLHAEWNERATVRNGYVLPGPLAPPAEGALLVPRL
jgi:arylsulfatase A-like enzyme